MGNDPDKFLSLIRSAHRGRHKLYLGYCAGVGKTSKMLKEAHRLRDVEKLDVVIGVLETHGRAETEALRGDLEEIPRRKTLYHGIELTEMDVGAAMERRPQVLLVDELAHTNVPGSKNRKRYQDVEELLEAGINVISTMNVQHLEGLYEVIGKSTGIRVTERVPDWVLSRADEVINVDLSTSDLRDRIRTGRVYPQSQIESALGHFFVEGNLQQLRELTLRELAAQLDRRFRYGDAAANGSESTSPEKVLVCLSGREADPEALLRAAARLAGRLDRDWYALHVETPEEARKPDAERQRRLDRTMELASLAGAKVFAYKGNDVAAVLLQFAREHRVGQVVVGPPKGARSWLGRLRDKPSLLETVCRADRGFQVVVV